MSKNEALGKDMGISQELRRGAETMRFVGFSPELAMGVGDPAYSTCFLGVLYSGAASDFFCKTIFNGDDRNFGAEFLRAQGWTTDDAAAALEVAADIAEVLS